MAIVFIMNVMCALQFILTPASYVEAYSLEGQGAVAAVQGFGVCFLMWNATYPAVIVRPTNNRVLFVVVLVQQAIGLVGESLIRTGVDSSTAAYASITRFIVFDAIGLVLLVVAILLAHAAGKVQR